MESFFNYSEIKQWFENWKIEKDIKLPEYILKFYSPNQYNFDALKNGEIYVADPSKFNDPYDCKLTYNREDLLKRFFIDWICKNCKDIERGITRENNFDWGDINIIYNTKDPSPINHKDDYEKTIEDALISISLKKDWSFKLLLDKTKNKLVSNAERLIKGINGSSKVGVCCFCNCDEGYNIDQTNLMWSHYARNHEGFCVMYCFDERITGKPFDEDLLESLFPVKYTKHRIFITKMIILRYLKRNLSHQDFKNIIDKKCQSLLTKSTVWKYENEWRLISNKIKETIKFPYATAIFIGCKASSHTKQTLLDISNKLKIPIYQTELDNKVYQLNNFNPKQIYWDLQYKYIWHKF